MRGKTTALLCAASIACVTLMLAAPLRAQQVQGEEEAPAEDNSGTRQAGRETGFAEAEEAGAEHCWSAAKHSVVVTNDHGNPLVILSVTPPGASDAATVVLLRDLPVQGQEERRPARHGLRFRCVRPFRGRFDDRFFQAELCKDHSINIRD